MSARSMFCRIREANSMSTTQYPYLLSKAKKSLRTAGFQVQSIWFPYIDVYLYPRLPQYTRATRLLLFRRGDYRVYPAINVSSSQIRYYGHLTAQPTLKRSECVAPCTSYYHRLCYGIPTDAPVNTYAQHERHSQILSRSKAFPDLANASDATTR
jgi:hypothetical protein